jgi:hypothetical protein
LSIRRPTMTRYEIAVRAYIAFMLAACSLVHLVA